MPVLPRLDRPATPEDVEHGLAVFSLSGEEEARTWPLPASPTPARWVTLKTHPRDVQMSDSDTGKVVLQTEYEQDGVIWQAEEVRGGDGRWQRYYGFVGTYDIARVPAEEIEFLPPATEEYFWSSLARQLDVGIAEPGGTRTGTSWSARRIDVGKSFAVTLLLRNRRGVSQTVPATWVAREPSGRSAVRPGVGFRLTHCPEVVAPDGKLHAVEADPDKWKDVPARPRGTRVADDRTRELAPGEAFAAGDVDLRDLFDVRDAGAYQLEVRFDSKAGGIADGKSYVARFSIQKAGERPSVVDFP